MNILRWVFGEVTSQVVLSTQYCKDCFVICESKGVSRLGIVGRVGVGFFTEELLWGLDGGGGLEKVFNFNLHFPTCLPCHEAIVQALKSAYTVFIHNTLIVQEYFFTVVVADPEREHADPLRF